MNFNIITIFPEMFSNVLEYGIVGRAKHNNIIQVDFTNPRDFAVDIRKTVDEKPYGGGPGMIMMPEPLAKSIDSIKSKVSGSNLVVYLSPQGKKLTQQDIPYLTSFDNLTLLCGRYEGIDERILDTYIDEEWSIGDYVISGGELAAMIMIDSITRTLPGVVNTYDSITEDSFQNGLLDYPQYTKPVVFQGQCVPDVLLSGHHAKIKQWREKRSLYATKLKRPDLLINLALTDEQNKMLNEIDQLFLEEEKND